MTATAAPGALTPERARALFRDGTAAPTTGWSAGYTQVNLVSLPQDWAYEFLLFCQRNPTACPVLDVTDPGGHSTPLAPGADLRTDLPRYRVWEHGELVDEPDRVVDRWRPELVTFLIGCSFTFESALAEAGVPLRHGEQGRSVPMFRTTVECRPAGRLRGPMVVSMRPVPADLVDTAVRATALMPGVHGAPVHTGDPAALGIDALDRPHFGDPVSPAPGDVPVFWGCGVTPQAVLMASRPPFAITHAPGYMFITDARDTDYRIA
ncbi:putative hydro-lyase [Streptomyces sp. NPDC002055]|uniref:putative hydro-lyase n=1 Tax=Streptomyces sp. NPDC002055 TaxID=3154534 RepID=UPI0033171758